MSVVFPKFEYGIDNFDLPSALDTGIERERSKILRLTHVTHHNSMKATTIIGIIIDKMIDFK